MKCTGGLPRRKGKREDSQEPAPEEILWFIACCRIWGRGKAWPSQLTKTSGSCYAVNVLVDRITTAFGAPLTACVSFKRHTVIHDATTARLLASSPSKHARWPFVEETPVAMPAGQDPNGWRRSTGSSDLTPLSARTFQVDLTRTIRLLLQRGTRHRRQQGPIFSELHAYPPTPFSSVPASYFSFIANWS
jgi:hypothetical protein